MFDRMTRCSTHSQGFIDNPLQGLRGQGLREGLGSNGVKGGADGLAYTGGAYTGGEDGRTAVYHTNRTDKLARPRANQTIQAVTAHTHAHDTATVKSREPTYHRTVYASDPTPSPTPRATSVPVQRSANGSVASHSTVSSPLQHPPRAGKKLYTLYT